MGMRTKIRNRYQFTFPYLSLGMIMVLLVVYAIEQHPPNLQIGQYFISAISCWGPHELISEISLILIGGIMAEQFTDRWVVAILVYFLAPAEVWLSEATHPGTLVLGFSGGSFGLIGFSLMAILWYLVDKPESEAIFISFSIFVLLCLLELITAFYGYFLHQPIFSPSSIIHLYSSNTMYIAHVTGSVIGGGWWITGYYLDGVR